MTQGIIGGVFLMGLVGLEVCQWRIGIPLIIVWISLMGLGGLLWALVLTIFSDDRYADDRRLGSAWPLSHDGEESHDHSSWQSETNLNELAVRRES